MTRYQPKVRQLTLRLVIPDQDPCPDVYPVVSILIDGQQILPGADHCGYRGSPPAAILDTGAPLLPTSLRRRIVVSGTPECGYVAPVISAARGKITWTDFESFMDLGDPPFVRPEEVASGWQGHPIDFPDLTFDAGQYTDEVRQISAEREWESDPWRTAQLFDTYMHPGNAWTRWEFAWAEPVGSGTFRATCFDQIDNGIEATLTPPPGSPRQQARWMADYLLSAPAEDWPITRSFRR